MDVSNPVERMLLKINRTCFVIILECSFFIILLYGKDVVEYSMNWEYLHRSVRLDGSRRTIKV